MSLETFDAAWLELREQVDHASRAPELAEDLDAWWTSRDPGGYDTSRLRVVDLGGGTGSNLRYLGPRLGGPQSWRVIDRDASLLERVHSPRADVAVQTQVADLADIGSLVPGGLDLVTASALLDLVSLPWLEALARASSAAGSAALFALTYDGTIDWHGATHPTDELVRSAVNAHQRRDKGLGTALGPDAGRAAADAFEKEGYRTRRASSPWRLGATERPLAQALVAGWVEAAVEERPGDEGRIRTWSDDRSRVLAAGDFSLTVGHVDVLALPPVQR